MRAAELESSRFAPLGVVREKPFVFKLSVMGSVIETRRYIVSGRVQGVGFRWFVEREARTLGLAGWVRNRSDGSVEVLASGTREQLRLLYNKLREGPRASRVDHVETEDAAPLKDLHTFRIEGAW
jgi:acylphosphatase